MLEYILVPVLLLGCATDLRNKVTYDLPINIAYGIVCAYLFINPPGVLDVFFMLVYLSIIFFLYATHSIADGDAKLLSLIGLTIRNIEGLLIFLLSLCIVTIFYCIFTAIAAAFVSKDKISIALCIAAVASLVTVKIALLPILVALIYRSSFLIRKYTYLDPSEIVVGDVVLEDIPEAGLRKGDIVTPYNLKVLRKIGRKIKVLEGMPFIPVIALSYFLYLAGDIFMVFFLRLLPFLLPSSLLSSLVSLLHF